MAEWSKAGDCKSLIRKYRVSSNLTLTSNFTILSTYTRTTMDSKKFTKILIKNERQIRRARNKVNKMIADVLLKAPTEFTESFLQSCIPPDDSDLEWLPRDFVFRMIGVLKDTVEVASFLVRECNGSDIVKEQISSFNSKRDKLYVEISSIGNNIFSLTVEVLQRRVEEAIIAVEKYIKELLAIASEIVFIATKTWEDCKNDPVRKQTVLVYNKLKETRKNRD